jgi:hypothetical protein
MSTTLALASNYLLRFQGKIHTGWLDFLNAVKSGMDSAGDAKMIIMGSRQSKGQKIK